MLPGQFGPVEVLHEHDGLQQTPDDRRADAESQVRQSVLEKSCVLRLDQVARPDGQKTAEAVDYWQQSQFIRREVQRSSSPRGLIFFDVLTWNLKLADTSSGGGDEGHLQQCARLSVQ